MHSRAADLNMTSQGGGGGGGGGEEDKLKPPVPCLVREAARHHRQWRARESPLVRAHDWREQENKIKISSIKSRRRKRSVKGDKINCCNYSPTTSSPVPLTLKLQITFILPIVVLLIVHLFVTHQHATASHAHDQHLSITEHHQHQQHQAAPIFRHFEREQQQQHDDDKWLRSIIIIHDVDDTLRQIESDNELALRSRRNEPTSQEEFAAPDADQEPTNSSANSEKDEQQVDGGNQFDGEHSAAAAYTSGDNDDQPTSKSSYFAAQATDGHKSMNATGGQGGNQSQPVCDTLEDVELSRPPRTFGMILATGYGIIFVLGLIGNVITLYVLWCKGKKRTAQDVIVANLAISDILLCVFCVPIMPKYLIIDGYWTLGLQLCKVVSFAQSTSVYMSTYSLIYIGWIRYMLIVHPLVNNKWATRKKYSLAACAITWCIAIGLTIPYTNKVRLAPQECEIMFCDEDWDGKYWRFFFSLFTTVFQFIIPLVAVGFFNHKIYARLDERRVHGGGGSDGNHHGNSHAKSIITAKISANTTGGGRLGQPAGKGKGKGAGAGGTIEPDAHTIAGETPHLSYNFLTNHHHVHPREPSPNAGVMAIKEHKQREKNRRMRKANNRLIFVVVVFAHSWLPLNLFNMIQDYFEELGHWKYLTTTFLVVHQIACSSVIWNPILYAWMSETYRSELRAALPKFLVNKFSSFLSDGPHGTTGGGAGGGHGVHGPASTSVCTMHLNNNNNNNNNTNGHHRRSSNHFANNGAKSHMNLNQHPLQMHTELAKAKSIDHISEVRSAMRSSHVDQEQCIARYNECNDDEESQSLGHRSEIILTQPTNDSDNNLDNESTPSGGDGGGKTGGRISPEVVSSG